MDYGKVSVIVPVYRVEKYLDRCVQSIVDQTYKNLEILLVDDGSPDSCPARCDAWAVKDDRILVIHKDNGGLSSARNAGLDIAKGTFVTFVDSDDWIESTMIEILVKDLIASDVDFSGCFFFKDCNEQCINGADMIKEKQIERTSDAFSAYFSKESFFIVLVRAKLYKSSLIGDTRFDELLKGCEDVDFLYKIIKQRPSCVEDSSPLYHYVLRSDSISKKETGEGLNWLDNVRVNARIFEDQDERSIGYAVSGLRLVMAILAAVFHLTKMGLLYSDSMQQIVAITHKYNNALKSVHLSFRNKILWRAYARFPVLFCKLLKAYCIMRKR